MASISNGESGSSVRTKLNASLAKTAVLNETGANIAAAATVNLAAATGDTVNITGSGATITSFGTVPLGTVIYVIFAGINTITDSANVKCPNGDDITTAANDGAEIYGEGGGVVTIRRYDTYLGEAENTLNKDESGGYAGLTLLKINFKNVANTITSFFTNSNAVSRTYTFPDKDGTVALLQDTVLSGTASGTDTYAVTISPAPTAYIAGQKYCITFTNANTGAATLNTNSLGAKTIKKNGSSALASGDIGALGKFMVEYDGTDFIIVGKVTTTGTGDLLAANNLSELTPTSLTAKNNIGSEKKGSDTASAGTTDIGAVAGDFLDITGTTTITSFGTVGVGTEKTLRFTGILLLTHNATSLILPTSTNITTQAGDTAIFKSLGSGNWVCTSYLRKDGTALAGSGGGMSAGTYDPANIAQQVVGTTAAQTLTNKTLTEPIIGGTPNADGEFGFDTTYESLSYYGNGQLGTIPKIIARGNGTESKTNSTTSDQDYTSIYTFPANTIYTGKMYKISVCFQVTTGTSTATHVTYLKLGATKVAASTASNFTDGTSSQANWVDLYIYGEAAAGGAAAVITSYVTSRATTGLNTISQPINLATNGTLDVVLGATWSATGSTETVVMRDWVIVEY